jgi:hypothetical protein
MRIKPENVSVIQELGFPLMYRRKGEVSFRKYSGFKDSASAVSEEQRSYLSSLLKTMMKENKRLFNPDDISDDESDLSQVDQMEYMEGEVEDYSNFEYKFDFMEPFDIIKAYHTQERLGLEPSEILVWPGGVKRITDQIPSKVLNRLTKEGEKDFRRKTHFSLIENIETKLSILYKHTHW